MSPGGIPEELRDRVRKQARERCGYCLSQQRHFQWSEDGTLIVGRTACGRATVMALQMNNLIAVTVRQQWVIAGWHPPEDV